MLKMNKRLIRVIAILCTAAMLAAILLSIILGMQGLF